MSVGRSIWQNVVQWVGQHAPTVVLLGLGGFFYGGLIVFGNESNGISEEIINVIFERITINKIGEAESLNVAVSAAIILNKFCN